MKGENALMQQDETQTQLKEEKKNDEIDYVSASIGSLYRRLLPSAIGSLLTATVASFIDVVILSHYLGPGMLAIIGLCMPIYMLVNTLSMLIASGASTLYALGPEPSYLVPESGIALGLFEDAALKDFVLTFKPGEGILLYTDGITEAVNPQNLFFGEERLLKVVTERVKNTPDKADDALDVINQVSDAVLSFSENCEPFDDAVSLVLFYKGSGTGFISLPVALSSFDEVKKAVFSIAGETPEARQALLACDEVLTNIVSYSGTGILEFSCTKEKGNLIITFSDDGVPFDPTPVMQKEKSFEFLDSGGMGLSLIRQNVSSMTYERKNGRNELTLCF